MNNVITMKNAINNSKIILELEQTLKTKREYEEKLFKVIKNYITDLGESFCDWDRIHIYFNHVDYSICVNIKQITDDDYFIFNLKLNRYDNWEWFVAPNTKIYNYLINFLNALVNKLNMKENEK